MWVPANRVTWLALIVKHLAEWILYGIYKSVPLIVTSLQLLHRLRKKSLRGKLLTGHNRQLNGSALCWFWIRQVLQTGVNSLIFSCDVLYPQRTVLQNMQSVWFISSVFTNLAQFDQLYCLTSVGGKRPGRSVTFILVVDRVLTG